MRDATSWSKCHCEDGALLGRLRKRGEPRYCLALPCPAPPTVDESVAVSLPTRLADGRGEGGGGRGDGMERVIGPAAS